MTDLKPDTTYWYRAGSAEGGFSAPASFRTAPSGVRDFTFTALGDHGTSPDSRANIWHMLADKPAFAKGQRRCSRRNRIVEGCA